MSIRCFRLSRRELRALALATILGATLGALGCSKTKVTEGVPNPDKRAKCSFHSDCANGGACFRGFCNPTVSCIERRNCSNVPICADSQCICGEATNRCLPVCVTDDDCSADGQCVNGVCTPYPARFNPALPPSGERGNLRVGVAEIDLDFPMGVSMAGYGGRRGPRTPYQAELGGSNAWFQRPDVRAVAFDDGKELFVLLRIPISWSTGEVLAATALKVQEKTGLNMVDRIITSATHSHSQPARFWHLVKGLGFGFFGYDEFNYEIFDRLTTSFAEAVVKALDARQPARFGYKVIDNFDPERRIHRKRRHRSNRLAGHIQLDDQMLIMRVDDAGGRPIAVLTNFGIHGTVFGSDNPIITGDAPGGIEGALTFRASEKYGRPVTGFFIQGNAGDISPSGDDLGHHDLERIQLIGERAWRVIEAQLDQITTEERVEVGMISGQIPITHEGLGYRKNEFFDRNVSCESSASYFRYGAFQCVDGRYDDEDPSTFYVDGDLDCVFSVECLTGGHPVPQFQKTHLAIARLGDLALPTLPGEPVGNFGRSVAERAKSAIPGVKDAITIGYSMDHHFYLLDAEDWVQGGYEPSRDIWGWKLGPYLSDRSAEMAKELAKPVEQRRWASGNLKPMIWSDPENERVPVAPNDTTGSPDQVVKDVLAPVERLELVTFSWKGGHPGIDRPHIVLEVERNGSFVPFTRPGGAIYDDHGFEMMVEYRGSCSRSSCTDHAWAVIWEERRDFPIGRYRFRVEGKAQQSGRMGAYRVESTAFALGPSRKLNVYDLHVTGGQIEGRIADPPVVTFLAQGDRRVADNSGAHLLQSTLVPSYIGAPISELELLGVSGTIRRSAGPTAPITASIRSTTVLEPRRRIVAYDSGGAPEWQAAGVRPTSKILIDSPVLADGPAGDYQVELTIADRFGNSGTIATTITK